MTTGPFLIFAVVTIVLKMRSIFYILTVMMESENSQKNGVVLVANTKVRERMFPVQSVPSDWTHLAESE